MGAGALLLLVLLVGGVLSAVRQLLLYPARLREWRFAFGSEHRDARRPLRKARRRRRAVRRVQRWQVAEAEKKIKRVGKPGQKRIRKLGRERDRALRPRRGRLLYELGVLRLYEHELVVLSGDPDAGGSPDEEEVMYLHGLGVTFGSLPDYSYIEITKQDDCTRDVNFPSAVYDPSYVKDFQAAIRDQIVEDREQWDQRYADAARIDADIAQAEADKDIAVNAARAALHALLRDQAEDPNLVQADSAWNTACSDWEALTGHRPRWPWWWRR